MSGICGYAGVERGEDFLRTMTERLRHRGPDDGGLFLHARVGLGVRRLGVIDASGDGQPVFNERRSIVLVADGDIYNYRELTADLQRRGHRFATRSDAETIVHLYEEHGLGALDHLRGAFAFALYDADADRLVLARDRLGIKPLYYWQRGRSVLFASEIKALLSADDVPRRPNPRAVDDFIARRYVPGPETIYQDIYKLPGGHWLEHTGTDCRIAPYWTAAAKPGASRTTGDDQERFAELWRDAISLHLESDVAVGVVLGGDIESGLIVSEIARQTGRPVYTFSVAGTEAGAQAAAARALASELQCAHHEVTCTADDLRWLPQMIWASDEPLGDPIALPTFLLARLAREHVKVVLTAAGAGVGGRSPDALGSDVAANAGCGRDSDAWSVLQDDVLMCQDKMWMVQSVEARLPFLDHALVEFLLSLPTHLALPDLVRGGTTFGGRSPARRPPSTTIRPRQLPLHLPASTVDAPVFRELVAETLSPERVRRRGYIQPDTVRALLDTARTTGESDSIERVVALVALELWHQMFVDRVAWT